MYTIYNSCGLLANHSGEMNCVVQRHGVCGRFVACYCCFKFDPFLEGLPLANAGGKLGQVKIPGHLFCDGLLGKQVGGHFRRTAQYLPKFALSFAPPQAKHCGDFRCSNDAILTERWARLTLSFLLLFLSSWSVMVFLSASTVVSAGLRAF